MTPGAVNQVIHNSFLQRESAMIYLYKQAEQEFFPAL